jgi:hypothetical protein
MNTSANRLLGALVLLVLGSMLALPARAWGPQGHFEVGAVALKAADEKTASRVWQILGSNDMKTLDEACNWPDRIEHTPHWKWAASQHYVNIPRSANRYLRERDCQSGLCITEAIKKYAGQLADPGWKGRSRWRAFAWLCHLVGDLHQPLHAGYRDDRGGNDVNIIYKGEQENLHQFWDRLLVQERLPKRGGWQIDTPAHPLHSAARIWNPSEVNDWTSESHALVRLASYPPEAEIQADFADQSWLLIRKQWLKAGLRLAQILNATLGDGDVVMETTEPEPGSAD